MIPVKIDAFLTMLSISIDRKREASSNNKTLIADTASEGLAVKKNENDSNWRGGLP